MVFYNQLEGNNVQVSGYDLAGQPRAPTYNSKMGFSSGELRQFSWKFAALNMIIVFYELGAQTDIFHTSGSATTTYVKPAPTPTLSGDNRTATISLGMAIWVISLSKTLGFAAIWI